MVVEQGLAETCQGDLYNDNNSNEQYCSKAIPLFHQTSNERGLGVWQGERAWWYGEETAPEFSASSKLTRLIGLGRQADRNPYIFLTILLARISVEHANVEQDYYPLIQCAYVHSDHSYFHSQNNNLIR